MFRILRGAAMVAAPQSFRPSFPQCRFSLSRTSPRTISRTISRAGRLTICRWRFRAGSSLRWWVAAGAGERLGGVELAELGRRYPHQLSGGQMQRVAIARALVQSPAILLADEPTGNLDTSTGNLILELLQRLTRQQNTATIMATHSVEAAALADVVVKMRDGQIAEMTRQ